MSKSSSRRNSRLTTPVMITFVVIAALLIALTVASVVKAMTRGDDPVVVNSVLTGQSMEVNRTTGLDVIRFQAVRAPLPAEEDVADTLDTCLAGEARAHLESLAGEGTSLDVEIEAYANAPNGELWAEIYQGGNDLGVQMVEAGYAVVDPASVDDAQKLDAMRAAQDKARHDELGIFSTDADCTLPSQVKPVLEMLEDLPDSPRANDVTELTKYIGEMNRIRSDAQQTIAMLSAIPDTENDDSVAALAWGEAKQEYIDAIDSHLDDIQGLVEDAQAKRADLQGIDTPEPDPEPAPEPEEQPEQEQESGTNEESTDAASPAQSEQPAGEPAEQQLQEEPAAEVESAAQVESESIGASGDTPDDE